MSSARTADVEPTSGSEVGVRAPVRGTQSFVSVMVEVWKRPSLAGLEICWRWSVGVIALWICAVAIGSQGFGADVDAVRGASAFQPVAAVRNLEQMGREFWTSHVPTLRWLVAATVMLWLVVAAIGRTIALRRLDGALQPRRTAMLVLGALRAGLLAMVWAVWVWGVGFAVRVSLTGPAARGAEPSVVLFCAMLIVGSLSLYVLWGVVSWPFYLAPLLAMQLGVGPGAALKAAFASGAVRGKLVEINLVMNIVRIALIVLAMVFSASPLPFSSVETQTFLNFWWGGVGLLYLGISDYFHVVRSAAYLSLWRTYNFSAPGVAPGA